MEQIKKLKLPLTLEEIEEIKKHKEYIHNLLKKFSIEQQNKMLMQIVRSYKKPKK